MHSPSILHEHCIGSPNKYNEKRKVNNIQTWKEEIQLFLSADDMTVYAEKAQEIKEKFLELKDYSKATGYKTNVKKSTAFPL